MNTNMYRIKIFLKFFIIVLFPITVFAQNQSFLFTFTPSSALEKSSFVHYDAAYGKGTFEPLGGDKIEQNLGLQTNLGENFTLLAHAGLSINNGANNMSQQGELLANILKSANGNILDLSAGMGYRHEYSGTSVLLSRVMLGRQFETWQLYGNFIFEHAFSPDRDAVDLTTTVGFSYDLFNNVKFGIEVVGQDIEGFWEEDEAEGGAVLFFGPDVNISFPGTSLNLTIGGGEIIRASHSNRTSIASRDLPENRNNGFVIRNVVSFGF